MDTRAVSGFRFNGVDKVTYSHFDGYYSGVGMDIFKYIRSVNSLDWLKSRVKNLHLVSEAVPPTPAEQQKYEKFSDTGVSTGKLSEWYVLLRKCQGQLGKYIQAGVMQNDTAHLHSVDTWCEYAYIINLDDDTFEVYRRRSSLKYYKDLVVPNLPEDRGYAGFHLFGSFSLAEVRSPLPNRASELLTSG